MQIPIVVTWYTVRSLSAACCCNMCHWCYKTKSRDSTDHGVQCEWIEAPGNAIRAQDDPPLKPNPGAEVSMETRAIRVNDPIAPVTAVCAQEVPPLEPVGRDEGRMQTGAMREPDEPSTFDRSLRLAPLRPSPQQLLEVKFGRTGPFQAHGKYGGEGVWTEVCQCRADISASNGC